MGYKEKGLKEADVPELCIKVVRRDGIYIRRRGKKRQTFPSYVYK